MPEPPQVFSLTLCFILYMPSFSGLFIRREKMNIVIKNITYSGWLLRKYLYSVIPLGIRRDINMLARTGPPKVERSSMTYKKHFYGI